MLIRASDRAGEDEWRAWLADGRDFGQLVVTTADGYPIVVPLHFHLDGDAVLAHLAIDNPAWSAIEANPRVVLSVVTEYAYIPGPWRAPATAGSGGVPTSYYSAVQLCGRAEVVDDPTAKAEILNHQLAHHDARSEVGDRHSTVEVGQRPYGLMLGGIRGIRIAVEEVRAKFKYDDHKSAAHQRAVADRLLHRGAPHDAAAHVQLRRRLELGA